MTKLEYIRILEEYAKQSPSEEARAAYGLSLEMYMMVKDDPEYGKKTGDGRPEGRASDKDEPVKAESKAEKEEKSLKKAGYRKAYNFKPKECKNCGETFTPHYGSQTMCVECARVVDGIAQTKSKRQKRDLKISDPEYRRKMAEELAGGEG